MEAERLRKEETRAHFGAEAKRVEVRFVTFLPPQFCSASVLVSSTEMHVALIAAPHHRQDAIVEYLVKIEDLDSAQRKARCLALTRTHHWERSRLLAKLRGGWSPRWVVSLAERVCGYVMATSVAAGEASENLDGPRRGGVRGAAGTPGGASNEPRKKQ